MTEIKINTEKILKIFSLERESTTKIEYIVSTLIHILNKNNKIKIIVIKEEI